MNRFWNIAAVALLLVIALLVYLMPRFNYNVLLARQARLESGLNTLLEKTAKLERVVDVGGEKRSAGLKWIDDLPTLLERLQGKLSEVGDLASVTLHEVSVLESRVKVLEEGAATPPESGNPVAPEAARWSNPAYLRPIELGEDLGRRAQRLAPSSTAQLDTVGLVDKLLEAGIVHG
jgi:hypothetical protein